MEEGKLDNIMGVEVVRSTILALMLA